MKNSLFIITGASKGIGKGLAIYALKQGARVIGISRSHSITHEHYEAVTLDLSNHSTLQEKLPTIFPKANTFDRIVLINNAGTLGDVQHLGDVKGQSFVQLFDLNVTSPLLLMNQFIKDFRSTRAERVIINVSSGAGKNPVDGWSGYCASKAALDMATKVAAKEAKLDETGIIVKAIAPGVVDTGMQDQIRSSSEESFSTVDRFINLKKEGQLQSEEEVAEKYFKIIKSIHSYSETLLDVRNL